MKANKLTPGSNLLWESSRMMLPEHVEALNKFAVESKKKVRPTFDQQHLEQVERMVQQYINSGVNLAIVIFGEYENKEYDAIITKYDPQLRRMKLEWVEGDEEHYEWVRVEDIIDIFT